MANGMDDIAYEWSDSHKFSPSPRHRRRIILGIIAKIEFDSCLDAGCAQPYLLDALSKRGKQVFGCDISRKVVEANKNNSPETQFEVVDISREVYPLNRKFDLVISAEVLEHVIDWRAAVKNLTLMSNRYLLITVPSGKIRKIDALVGHLRHYTAAELGQELERNNFRVVLYRNWGAPFHSLYKYLINALDYKKTYAHFGAGHYGFFKKLLSHILYLLFYLNDMLPLGSQLFVLAKKNDGR